MALVSATASSASEPMVRTKKPLSRRPPRSRADVVGEQSTTWAAARVSIAPSATRDDDGPTMTSTCSCSSSSRSAWYAVAGSPPSSRFATCTMRPLTPPASLISCTASSTPAASGLPRAAAGPDVGSQTPMRSAPSTLRRTIGLVSSLGSADVVGTLPSPPPEQEATATSTVPAATARHRPAPPIAPECRCATGRRRGSDPAPIAGQNRVMATELLYLRDAYLRDFDAVVVDRRDDAVALDRTAFYPTGGGQPHDTGTLDGLTVTDVRKDGDLVWHTVDGGPPPALGASVSGTVDWDRRHALMRTHSALHVLCGVIWNEWRVPVTGGNMEPLSARMDFEFDPLPEGFGPRVEELVNTELAADRPIEIEFLARDVAVEDEDLIRTKVNMIPESVKEIRVVDIVGLDKQADGGTHVRTTGEVGRIRVTKTENKGKGNKRVRLEVVDG